MWKKHQNGVSYHNPSEKFDPNLLPILHDFSPEHGARGPSTDDHSRHRIITTSSRQFFFN